MKHVLSIAGIVILFLFVGINYQKGIIRDKKKEIKELKSSLNFCNNSIKNTSIASKAKGKIEQIDKEIKNEKVVNVGTNSYTF